jgi:hypothetical protein
MKLNRHFIAFSALAMLGLLCVSYPRALSTVKARGYETPRVTLPNRATPDERQILGILEHHNDGERKGHGVRVAFFKEGGQWKAFPNSFHTEAELSQATRSFPESVAWTVCFDGRANGTLVSKNPQAVSFYKDVGTHQIASEGSVPTVGRPSESFSGWPGGLTYRPLVLNSRADCADPGQWRPEKPSDGEVNAIKDYLRTKFQASAAKLSKARVTVNKSYGSKPRGAKLVSLNVSGAEVITTPGEDDQNKDAWFYVEGKEVRYLGSNMLLVDAGDYDGDGKEEAVFKIQRYDNDGYALFHDGFRQKVEFSWSYH